MTTQTLSDISTLKVGTLLSHLEDTWMVMENSPNLRISKCYSKIEYTDRGNEILRSEQITLSQKNIDDDSRWKIISVPFDIMKELIEKEDEFVYEDSMTRCGRLNTEALAKWIEDNKHNF